MKTTEAAQERLAAIVEASGDAIVGSTLDGIITNWNPAAERMFGYAAEEVIGQPRAILFPPDRADEEEAILERLQHGESIRAFESIRLRKEGKPIDVSLTISLIRDTAGNGIGAATIIRDVTEQKRLEQERRYVMAGANCLLWHADVEEIGYPDHLRWMIHLPDPEAAQNFLALELRDGEVYQDAWYRCRFEADRDRCDRLGTASVRAGLSYQHEFRIQRADGSIRWLHEDVRVETIVPGMRWRTVAVCTDITERKKAEQEIEALNARLRRAMTETHHRVKNNLQLICAILDMATMDYDDALPMAEVKQLSQQVKALAAIHDILTHKAQFSGEQTEEISVREVLHRLLTMLPSIGERIKLEYAIQDVHQPVRQATALAVIVNELVSNAVKNGGDAVRVTYRAQGHTARLEVEDNGTGFPIPFDLHTQAHTGLALIENLARHDLGGTLSFNNRPEGGARVSLELPLPELDMQKY